MKMVIPSAFALNALCANQPGDGVGGTDGQQQDGQVGDKNTTGSGKDEQDGSGKQRT